MNALAPQDLANATFPQVYQGAKQALAECATVDECKGWADRAAALASYAKQAADSELEDKVRAIRNRAIKRMGEILQQIEPQQGARTDQLGAAADPKLTRKQAANDAGISRRQSKDALRIASLSEDDFAEPNDKGRPATLTELASRGTKPSTAHLRGQDPKIYNKCLHFTADLEAAAKDLTGRNGILRHLRPDQLERAKRAAETLREICEEVEIHEN